MRQSKADRITELREQESALKNTTQVLTAQANSFMEEMAERGHEGTTVLLDSEGEENRAYNSLLTSEELAHRTEGEIRLQVARVRREIVSQPTGVRVVVETLHDKRLPAQVMPVKICIEKPTGAPIQLVDVPEIEQLEDYFRERLERLGIRCISVANFADGDEGCSDGVVTPSAEIAVCSGVGENDPEDSPDFSTKHPWSEEFDTELARHEYFERGITGRVVSYFNSDSDLLSPPVAPDADDLDAQNMIVAGVLVKVADALLERVAAA